MVTVRLEAEVLQTTGVSESLESRLSLEYLGVSCTPLSLEYLGVVSVLDSVVTEGERGEDREDTEGLSSRTEGFVWDNVEEMLLCASVAFSALGNVLFW